MTATVTTPRSILRDRAARSRQPILVLPGLAASDRSTYALRTNLRALGHPVHGWRLGRNEGPTGEIIAGLDTRFRELCDRYEGPISIVGWSMGGAYAWALGGREPELVRSVVTLGSPLSAMARRATPPPPSVPVTSIWSRNDGIVPAASSTIKEADRRENIEVRSFHFTLGFDPVVAAVVRDRVGQSKVDWVHYDPPAYLKPFLP